MNLLQFIPLLIFILIAVGLGAIPGAIAKRKNRSRALWWVSGTLGFPIALIAILCFKNLEQIPDEQKNKSKRKEQMVFSVIIFLLIAQVALRIMAL